MLCIGVAYGAYWEPGVGAAPQTHSYTVCDTQRQFCYYTELEFITPVLHGQVPYWVVRADYTVLAGVPHNMPFALDAPFDVTGDPVHDIPLLYDAAPTGIPTMSYVLLYDGMMHAPFTDQSRIIMDSLNDVLFGLNDFLDGPVPLRVGETWGDVAVTHSINGLFIIQYVGEGMARFLIDPQGPLPLAGVYTPNRYDPHVQNAMWFTDDEQSMNLLRGTLNDTGVDYTGPDDVMRAGTLAGLTWTSDTYTVQSISTTQNTAVIRGLSVGNGTLDIVMPAFGGSYTFWQGDTKLDATYDVTGGVLSGVIHHVSGEDIIIHVIPDDICTGDCIQDLVVRAWDGPTGIVYGSGFHGAVRMSLVPGDPDGVAPALCPPGSSVTVDFDVMEPPYTQLALPYTTTYESVLEVGMHRQDSTIQVQAVGEPAAITLRMPAMIGNISYTPTEPLASYTTHDTVTSIIQHDGGETLYTIQADGPSAWGTGLSIPPPESRTGVIWCGMASPVNAAIIQDTGVYRPDCGTTKFGGGWNVWC